MTALDTIANTAIDIKDLIAYAVFPVFNYKRNYEIFSANSNTSRSYIRLKASTKQALKPIAIEVRTSIDTNTIPTQPINRYSTRGILRHYRQRAEIKLAHGANIRPTDKRTLINFLDSIEREFL